MYVRIYAEAFLVKIARRRATRESGTWRGTRMPVERDLLTPVKRPADTD
jgi:hypothetical protein